MKALEFITSHVIYNPAYIYKFQLKTTNQCLQYLGFITLSEAKVFRCFVNPRYFFRASPTKFQGSSTSLQFSPRQWFTRCPKKIW